MNGLLHRIKAWFRKLFKPKTETGTQPTLQALPTSSEIEALLTEHQQLEAERERLRKEISIVDSKLSSGTISAQERDQAYRARLARAGQISIQQMQIRTQLLELGYPIPQEWRTSGLMRSRTDSVSISASRL